MVAHGYLDASAGPGRIDHAAGRLLRFVRYAHFAEQPESFKSTKTGLLRTYNAGVPALLIRRGDGVSINSFHTPNDTEAARKRNCNGRRKGFHFP